MDYPNINLKKDFEDINLNNYETVKDYDTAVKAALESGDFSQVQSIIETDANTENVLGKVVRFAEIFNNYSKAIEDLKNYTIAVKNQVFFTEISDSGDSDELEDLRNHLDKDDILIYTKALSDTSTEISKIEIKENNSFKIIYEKNSVNTYFFEITDDDIFDLEDTGETVDIITSVGGEENIHSETSGKYIHLSTPYTLSNGDIIRFHYFKSNPFTNGNNTTTINYIKINDRFFLVNYKRFGFDQGIYISSTGTYGGGGYYRQTSITLHTDNLYDFTFSSDLLAKVGATSDSVYIAGTVIYDSFGNRIGTNNGLLISKKEICTEWKPITLEPYSHTLHANLPDVTQRNIIELCSAFISNADSDVDDALSFQIKDNNLYIKGALKTKAIDSKYHSVDSNIRSSVYTDMKNTSHPAYWLKLFTLPSGCRPSCNWTTNLSGLFDYTIMISLYGDVYLGRSNMDADITLNYDWIPINIVCPLD